MQVSPNSGAFIARKSVEYRKSIFVYCLDILCMILSYNNFSDDNRKENSPMYWMPCPSVKGAISSPTMTIFLKLSPDIISHNIAYSKFSAKLHIFSNTAKCFHKIMELRCLISANLLTPAIIQSPLSLCRGRRCSLVPHQVGRLLLPACS